MMHKTILERMKRDILKEQDEILALKEQYRQEKTEACEVHGENSEQCELADLKVRRAEQYYRVARKKQWEIDYKLDNLDEEK